MATRVFSDEELAQLRGFPEITRDELIRFSTLTSANRAFVDPGRGRSARDRLGLAVQLCTLPWLGFVPDDVTAALPAVVTRLAGQLHVDAGALAGYGEREQTRTDHLRLVLQYAGWRVPRSLEVKELDEFLLARAMEHGSPSLLFRLACEHLRASQVVRPGVVTLSGRVAAAGAKAERETCDRLAHLLTDARCSELDGLLVTDAEIGMAQMRWLNTGPVEASAAAVKTEVAKLLFLRGLDAHTLDLSALPAERRRFLASVGPRSSMAKLARREPHRRYPIVLTVLAQSAVDVLDEVVQLFDQAVSARESRAKHKLAGQLAERAKRSEDKLAIAEQVLPVLADPAVADEQVGGLLRERIGMGRLRAAVLAEPATWRRSPSPAGPRQRSCWRRWPCCGRSTPPAPAACPPRPRTGSCRPAGAATSTTLSPPAMPPRIGATGNCASCCACAMRCVPAMCMCPGRAATPTRSPTSSAAVPGRGSEMSSAGWPASPLRRPWR